MNHSRCKTGYLSAASNTANRWCSLAWLALVFLAAAAVPAGAANTDTRCFAWDSVGGTLARDHQSRAMYHEGQHRRDRKSVV